MAKAPPAESTLSPTHQTRASEPVQLFPLGGLGEIGMNCLALACADEVVLLDCGVTFPNPALGANLIHPDFSALQDRRVVAVVLTHGHEDHLGAVPYLLREHQVPVYGPPYALALLRDRFEEHDLPVNLLRSFEPGTPFEVGPFAFEAIRVTHSTADCSALAIKTPAGVIVHSGDFKIDPEPTDGEHFDRKRFEELGRSGVRLLLSDSTNSFVEGTAGTEASVAKALQEQVLSAKQAVVVAVFASNVHRLRSLFDIARQSGRRVLALGRSVRRHILSSEETGYLEGVSSLLVSPKDARSLPRDQLLVVATGSQGEERAALSRLARQSHHDFRLEAGDRVVLSARIIPGHEVSVYDLINSLARQGVEVIFGKLEKGLHVSGHACQGEQAELIRLIQPKCFLPVHGTLIHMLKHAELARSCGVEQVLVVENGALLTLTDDSLEQTGAVPSGPVHVDSNFDEVPPGILKERARLAEVGVATAVLSLSEAGMFHGHVKVVTRGVIDPDQDPALVTDAAAFVKAALRDNVGRETKRDALESRASEALERFFRKELGWRPICVGVIAP